MTRLCKRLFGRDAWPMSVRSSPRGALYHIDPEVAEWWRQATVHASPPGPPAERTTTTHDPGTPEPATTVIDLRNRFFGEVLDRIVQQRPGPPPTEDRRPGLYRLGGGPFGHYALSFINDGRLVRCPPPDRDPRLTKRLFDLLHADRDRLGLTSMSGWSGSAMTAGSDPGLGCTGRARTSTMTTNRHRPRSGRPT